MATLASFPVLYPRGPVKITDLSTFAETALAMCILHKALRRLMLLFRLIPAIMWVERAIKWKKVHGRGTLHHPPFLVFQHIHSCQK